MNASLSLLTLNVHGARAPLTGAPTGDRIARLLSATGADVVLLQEVWTEPAGDVSALGRLIDPEWDERIFGGTLVRAGGEQGNAVLSRFKVLRHRFVDISLEAFEPRGFLHATLRGPRGEPLPVICVHFGLDAEERSEQFRRLEVYCSRAIGPGEPLLIGGDFNEWRRWRGGFEDRLGLRSAVHVVTGREGRTYPAFLPLVGLDRILFRGMKLATAKVLSSLAWRKVSDHLPVLARFEL